MQVEAFGGSGVFRYAGFRIRLIAELIDSLLLSIASIALELAVLGAIFWMRRLSGASVEGSVSGRYFDAFNPFFLQALNVILYALCAIVYFVWGHYRFGTTLGKLPLRIFVVDAQDFGPITFKQSLIRCLGYVVSYIPFGTGFLMAAFHPEKKTIHDLLAGTVSMIRPSPAFAPRGR